MYKLLFLFCSLWLVSCDFLDKFSHSNSDPENEGAMVPITQLSPKASLYSVLSMLCGDDPYCENHEHHNEFNEIKEKILSHKLEIDDTKDYLDSLYDREKDPQFYDHLDTVLDKIMDEPNYKILWNDFHGRYFDSMVVHHLIKHPPNGVKKAMHESALFLADYIESLLKENKFNQNDLDQKIHKRLSVNEFRFWLHGVPALKDIIDHPAQGSTQKLIKYLKKPKTNGLECISISFLLVKMGYAMENVGHKPSYFSVSDKFYKELHYLAKLVRVYTSEAHDDKVPQAGLALPGHPAFISESWMRPSKRPTAVRFPKLSGYKSEKEILARNALLNQLDHGVTWASGFSGSTSYNLYAWQKASEHNQEKLHSDIDLRSFVLGVVMFMVYDGGHSIFEVLWCVDEFFVYNQFPGRFGKGEDIHSFILDFSDFLNVYKDHPDETLLREAIDQSFLKTIQFSKDYLHNEPSTVMKLSGKRE